jgi:hypothetical protein
MTEQQDAYALINKLRADQVIGESQFMTIYMALEAAPPSVEALNKPIDCAVCQGTGGEGECICLTCEGTGYADPLVIENARLKSQVQTAFEIVNRGVALMTHEQVGQWAGVGSFTHQSTDDYYTEAEIIGQLRFTVAALNEELSAANTTNAAQAEQLVKLEQQLAESAANVVGWCQKIEQLEAQLSSDDDAIGEVVIEGMGIGDAQIVRFHMYKEIPPVGTKLYSRPLLQSSIPPEPQAGVELTDEEIVRLFASYWEKTQTHPCNISPDNAVIEFARALNQRQTVKPFQPTNDHYAGNWEEDFSHENGEYQCRCTGCGLMFIGHKRRVTCKLCANHAEPLSAAQGVPEGEFYEVNGGCLVIGYKDEETAELAREILLSAAPASQDGEEA